MKARCRVLLIALALAFATTQPIQTQAQPQGIAARYVGKYAIDFIKEAIKEAGRETGRSVFWKVVCYLFSCDSSNLYSRNVIVGLQMRMQQVHSVYQLAGSGRYCIEGDENRCQPCDLKENAGKCVIRPNERTLKLNCNNDRCLVR
jgi:hypothetical protein